ncbi:2-amino-4-hydroxy-6-hydroxymethyldihydropteridine diphosphokinase [Nitrosomonas aestuarii]|uniref:2-amino-4-hydroxy-6- hydroxymethyldihydropteridine diphosphokinase n=1 Tax=Nitrosomonas aestuarii TaxID=52441 RepID=UPI000D30F4B9|nr:2-amino-4-hydroxy-6-hydroxymethyldihydropteridine diphosphokinase [Nitrosomonas aestuarii]PTN12918.1 2-amino-4-hydroxy-6-hydroxymethyldihydropteridine diphosphokinase [Nitrosomonas aestuarii]
MFHSDKKYSLACIALGSNLENPINQVQQAYRELARLSGTDLLKRSSLYKSAPVGRLDQPDYINAVAQISTVLTPRELLSELLTIELQHERVRESPNAPRTLDLDILLYDGLQLCSEQLTIPHPRMTQRAFVLYPLMEIAPDCYIPGHGRISQLITACTDQVIERLNFS